MVDYDIEFQQLKDILERRGIVFTLGMTQQELSQIEMRYHFRFPPDYRGFLMYSSPISKGFVDWRNASEAEILGLLSRPSDGIFFDIEYNAFWMQKWGLRPAELQAALSICKRENKSSPHPHSNFWAPLYPCST